MLPRANGHVVRLVTKLPINVDRAAVYLAGNFVRLAAIDRSVDRCGPVAQAQDVLQYTYEHGYRVGVFRLCTSTRQKGKAFPMLLHVSVLWLHGVDTDSSVPSCGPM